MPLPARVILTAAGLAALVLLPLTACADAENPNPTAASAAGTPTSGSPTPGPPTPAASASPVSPSGRTATPPMSRTVPPTLGTPPKPPRPTEPTDKRATGLIAGHITRGGSGPCYGLVSEDGVEYALHGPGAGDLTEGSFVTLRISARPSGVDCGPGVRASIITR